MRTRRLATGRRGFGAARAIAALVAVLLTLALLVAPAVAQEFGDPEPGRRVYDRSGLLTPDEVAAIEERAAAVDQAGAPVVVYLQPRDTDFDETLQDARDLMDAWDIQSASGARDGVVILLNLKPNNLRRGELALVAGQAHFDGGNLPQRELDRITDAMLERLRQDDTAGGIALGLEMLETSLVEGPAPPPPPTAFEEAVETVAGSPLSVLNVVGAAVAAAIAWVGARVWQRRPQRGAAVTPSAQPPEDLPPALAGALTLGSLNDSQMEATVLDFALRGGLEFAPEDNKKKMQIRLLDPRVVSGEFEQRLWDSLEAEANEQRVIVSKRIAKVRSHWNPARQALRADLEARGWFARNHSERRRPAIVAGIVALLLAVGVFIVCVAGGQSWGAVGAGLLAAAGIGVLIVASQMPDTTPEGEERAAPWRGYLQGLKRARKDNSVELDLDRDVPYALAMNATSEVDTRLKAASATGYTPLWLGNGRADAWGSSGFYPYFIAFHTSMTPSTSSGSGGASAGSGGSGGSF